jgi:Transglycosylase SLT domain
MDQLRPADRSLGAAAQRTDRADHGTIGAESSGNPNAVRHEPGYTSDNATPGKVSIGLMQTLISTARSALNQPNLQGDDLRDPATSIDAGTAYIVQEQGATGFDPPVVACAYNAGSVRHNDGAQNRWKMIQYPIGTSEHADRWVKWFNDCFLLFADPAIAAPATTTPSFMRLLTTASPVA